MASEQNVFNQCMKSYSVLRVNEHTLATTILVISTWQDPLAKYKLKPLGVCLSEPIIVNQENSLIYHHPAVKAFP